MNKDTQSSSEKGLRVRPSFTKGGGHVEGEGKKTWGTSVRIMFRGNELGGGSSTKTFKLSQVEEKR